MIGIDQISESKDSSIFNVPFKVAPVVVIGQILSIILVLATQTDLLVPIRNFALLGPKSNWDAAVGEEGNKSLILWSVRIALPNLMQTITGLLVIFISFVIIVQADNIIDLLKDFTALMVISEVDNVLFQLASHGYLGNKLTNIASKVGDTSITSSNFASESLHARQKRSGLFYVRLVFFLLLTGMFSGWGVIFSNQRRGVYFSQKFPDCENVDLGIKHFGDGICYGGPLNTLDCAFEDGDCANFNEAYPLCKGDNLLNVQIEVGNGYCDLQFAIPECDYDGGDCCPYNITRSPEFQDGQCNGGLISTMGCTYDGGDCDALVREFPECPLDSIAAIDGSSDIILGDGICESAMYAGETCGREYGDCDVGQFGQDILLNGVSSGAFMYFEATLNAIGSKVMIGQYKTDTNTDVFNPSSPGKVKFFDFDENKKEWKKSIDLVGEENGDQFGFTTAMNYDGTQVVVGSHRYNGKTGKVGIFRFNSLEDKWVPYGQALSGPINAWNGYKVDMTKDGSKIAFSSVAYSPNGIVYTGLVRVFQIDSFKKVWEQVGQNIQGEFTREAIGYYYVQLNSSGSRVFFSSGLDFKEGIANRAYEFNDTVNEWTKLGKDIVVLYPQIIQKPAINEDGSRIAVSSYTKKEELYSNHGQVQVYDLDMSTGNATWVQVGPTITAEEPKDYDGFGYHVDMSADGDLLAIVSMATTCLGQPDFCATGSINLYRYSATNAPHRLFSRVPYKKVDGSHNVMQETARDLDGNIFGWKMSLSDDGSVISVGGYDFVHDFGFVKVYDVDDLFYPECNVYNPKKVGDGTCSEFEPYYTKECGFDGGDCSEPVKVEGYDDCYVMVPNLIGNGNCNDQYPYISEECGNDGGDCDDPVEVPEYPGCFLSFPDRLGGGSCTDKTPYNTIECGFDAGACLNP